VNVIFSISRHNQKRFGPDTSVTKNSRYMGDSRAGSWSTSSQYIGECVPVRGDGVSAAGDYALARGESESRYIGDYEPVEEAIHSRDMGDGVASTGAHALGNDVPNG
jgi:hypothetical protein